MELNKGNMIRPDKTSPQLRFWLWTMFQTNPSMVGLCWLSPAEQSPLWWLTYSFGHRMTWGKYAMPLGPLGPLAPGSSNWRPLCDMPAIWQDLLARGNWWEIHQNRKSFPFSFSIQMCYWDLLSHLSLPSSNSSSQLVTWSNLQPPFLQKPLYRL